MKNFLVKTSYIIVHLQTSNIELSKALVIRDVGPWDKFMSVTNGAEEVVEELYASGHLYDGRRLLYYDSENQLDEIRHKNGKFTGFAAGPTKEEIG